jgi:methylamine---glutamate N-methyltransferase subunit C
MSDDSKKQPTISCAPDGPLIVQGLTALIGPEDEALETTPTVALCRCGGSKNRPFCDGTHAQIGFSGAKGDGRQPDRRDSYVGKTITIHDNRGICSHAGFCTDGLPKVFRMGTEPWIDPDGAELSTIIETVAKCPSGALSYSIEETEYRDPLRREPAIRVTPDGPYHLEGYMTLQGVDLLEGTSEEHRTLCRCGQSKNKPFCDGAHWYVGQHDSAEEPAAAVDGAAAGSAVTAGGPPEEPHNAYIQELARHGLERTGAHGPMAAMGVPRDQLPSWDDLQLLTGQLRRLPRLEGKHVDTELVVGPKAQKPLKLKIPIIVSDMSFGALSEESKVALATGAELAGTGICSGEGGMLPEEQAACSRYFYELASARFGFRLEQLEAVQAFHFKGGQGAKTGTGGHLPGEKVTEKIAQVRGLQPGEPAVSPPRFPDWEGVDDYRRFADAVRERTGGIPIGFKLSAQHIEKDIDAALKVGVDYVILDGRGGGTGAAPLLFRDNISVPTIPALARARRHLDEREADGVTLFITGGLRTPADFTKALALGADGVAIANSAIQAIGCLGSRQCHTNSCPAGIATQDPALRALIDVERASQELARFLDATVHLMCTLARACGHRRLADFSAVDLTTFRREMAYLSGVSYGGVVPL